MKPAGPYRAGRRLANLIAPDRRRLHAFLLCLFGLLAGGLLVLVGPKIATAFTPSEPPGYEIVVRVESDHAPVPGALVFKNQHPIGGTDAAGSAVVRLRGVEGEVVDLWVRCPRDFEDQPKSFSVRLFHLSGQRLPEYSVRCTPRLRHVVIGIKADGGSNLPVVYLNKTVTRTDSSGAASFAVEAAPGAHLQVTLDTSERPDLSPENPTKLFVVGREDEMTVFEQHFEHADGAPL